MTWSVSKSGPKQQVKEQVVEQVTNFHQHPTVAAALAALIDGQRGPNVCVSGSGSDTSVSLSISSSS